MSNKVVFSCNRVRPFLSFFPPQVSTGNTQFHFHAGGLHFHLSTYKWLVVTGSNNAKFKGVGTVKVDGNDLVNNGGKNEWKFMIWGANVVDTFRIKI
jgi:hypothetical protein